MTIEEIWQAFRRHKHLGQALDQTEQIDGTSNSVVNDSDVVFSDITTNDVSTTEHGFAPKLPGTATKYLDGLGNWSTPPSSTIPTLFNGTVKVLVVGSGGGGAQGNTAAGGGGGGEVVYNAAFPVIAHLGIDQAYTVTVGPDTNAAGDGASASFHSITAVGGKQGTIPTGGQGGGTTGGDGGTGHTGSSGDPGQNGTANSITGSSVYYGGGGGGAGTGNAAGGQGGGGIGSNAFGNFGVNGVSHTGGGGGGSAANTNPRGGSGIVIISYVTADFGPCTGGTITTDGANTVHTFWYTGTSQSFIVVAI